MLILNFLVILREILTQNLPNFLKYRLWVRAQLLEH